MNSDEPMMLALGGAAGFVMGVICYLFQKPRRPALRAPRKWTVLFACGILAGMAALIVLGFSTLAVILGPMIVPVLVKFGQRNSRASLFKPNVKSGRPRCRAARHAPPQQSATRS